MFRNFVMDIVKVVSLLAVIFTLSFGLCAVRDWCTTGEVDIIEILTDYPSEEQTDEELVLTEEFE